MEGDEIMRASSTNIDRSIRAITKHLVVKLAKRLGISEDKALSMLMKTMTYELLQDRKSYLYAESAEYVYDMLDAELTHDIERWKKL